MTIQTNTRNFLPNLHIVEALLAFREGDLLRLTIDAYLKIADKVIVLLDNWDKETEDVVRQIARGNERVIVGRSTITRSLWVDEEIEGKLNERFKEMEGEIRQQLLNLVRKEHEKKPIDILLMGDSDEIFTNHFPKILEKFWESDKQTLMTKYIQMIGDFNTFHNRPLYSHNRAFKYRPDLSSLPLKGQLMLHPYTKKDVMRGGYFTVHLADFSKEYMDRRAMYKKRPFSEELVWRIDKDVRDLSHKEYAHIVSKTKPYCCIKELLYEMNRDYYAVSPSL